MKPGRWPLRDVTLKVLDLSVQTEFYQDFGLALLDRSDRHANLAAGEARLLLKRLDGGEPVRRGPRAYFILRCCCPTGRRWERFCVLPWGSRGTSWAPQIIW